MNQDDHIIFDDSLQRFSKLKRVVADVEEKHPGVSEEVFTDFYRPELRKTDHPLIKQVRRNERFHKMRENTILNRPSTSFATLGILKAIKEGRITLPKEPEKAEKTPEMPREESEIPKLYDVDDTEKAPEMEADASTDEENVPDEPNAEDVDKAFNELLNEANGNTSQTEQDEAIQEAMNDAAIDQALQEAEQEITKMRNLMRAAGLGMGATQEISPETWEKFVPFIEENRNIKELLDLAGRLYRTIDDRKRHSYIKGSGVIVGIETGNNIERLLPTELAKVKSPILRSEFYRGLIEGSLLQFELEDKDVAKGGPVFVCVDQSGSMAGNPDKWSKALSLAIARTMIKEERPFAFMPFDTEPGKILWSVEFQRKTMNLDVLTPMLTSFKGGGTNFEKALITAKEFINEHLIFEKNADIIFITDGNDRLPVSVTSDLSKWKKDRGVSILGVQIGGSTENLKAFCDSIVRIGGARNMNEKDDDIIKWVLTPKERRVS